MFKEEREAGQSREEDQVRGRGEKKEDETYLVPLGIGTDLSDERTVDGKQRIFAVEQLRLSNEGHVVSDVVLSVSSDLIDLARILVGVSSTRFVCLASKTQRLSAQLSASGYLEYRTYPEQSFPPFFASTLVRLARDKRCA